MKNTSFWFLVSGFLLLINCNSVTSSQQPAASSQHYFDLDSFFTQQIHLLDSIKPTVQKTVFLNGKKEEKELKEINWKEELSVFLESDINKLAWKDKYEVDTSLKDDPNIYFYIIRFTAKDKNLKTQKITVNIIKDIEQINSIHIKNVSENLLYSSITNLMFIPEKEYSIKTKQQIRFLKPDKYEVKGKWGMD